MTSNTSAPPLVRQHSKKRTAAPFVGIAVAVLAAVLWYHYRHDAALSVFGTLVSTVGVLLAIAIYDRQSDEGTKTETRAQVARERETEKLSGQNNAIMQQVEVISQGVSGISKNLNQSGQGPDPYADDSDWVGTHGLKLATGYNAVATPQIPVQVVADLVRGWQLKGTKRTASDGWRVERLVAAFRKSGGGNKSWFVVAARDETPTAEGTMEDFRIFRVSKGGRAKDEPTTSEILNFNEQLPPDRADEILPNDRAEDPEK